MAEYIEREAVLKIIDDNCPHDKGGYNTEEEMGAGAACYYIRKDVDNIPTADVVPKSEVDEIVRQWKEEANCWQNNYIAEIRDNEQIKKEVAREIFAEIDSLCIDTFGNFSYRRFVELKKKYTEVNNEIS